MENALLEALSRQFRPRPPHLRNGQKFAVIEKGYSGERVVYRTSTRADAERIAAQHAARRVEEV